MVVQQERLRPWDKCQRGLPRFHNALSPIVAYSELLLSTLPICRKPQDITANHQPGG